MSTPPSFDLLDQPWIRVRDLDGVVSERSMRFVLSDAHRLRGLAGEIPTQDAALIRLLLAVLLGALRPEFDRTETEAVTEWAEIWDAGRLPMDKLDAYLEPLRGRFDLLHPETPFYQVAGLTTASGNHSGLTKLIADMPDGVKYFTTRGGRQLDSLALGEAARWLVHCQAFDPSGIKTGAVGDERVKGGRGYPLGPPAWAGTLGLVIAEGTTLFETLILNLPLMQSGPDDLPVWEAPPLGPGVQGSHVTPRGAADALTWPSRRIRVFLNGERVTDVQISNGDKLMARNQHHVEPMSAWRWSKAQSSPGDDVLMPVTHDPARRLWQGLGPILIREHTTSHDIRPRVVDWLALAREHGVIGRDYMVNLWVVGIGYGPKAATIADAVDDRLASPIAALTSPLLGQVAVDAAAWARDGVYALTNLVKNLERACGGEGTGDHEAVRDRGYTLLEPAYRAWIRDLTDPADAQAAKNRWAATASALLRREGEALVAKAGPLAIIGRQVRRPNSDDLMLLDAGVASIWFRSALARAFPLPTQKEEVVA